MFLMIDQQAVSDFLAANAIFRTASAESIEAFNRALHANTDVNPILKIDGDTANISINGVLTNRPSFFASLMPGGSTAYSSIIDAIYKADANPAIKNIKLLINSPGGMIDGMFEAMDVIAATDKNVEAIGSGTVASAAYGLMSQAKRASASNDALRIGSIGIVVDIPLDASVLSLTSENAPNKRPDINTEEGKAIIKSELNDVERLFASRIARGRTVASGKEITSAVVNSDFGRGGMFLSEKALQRGMIDAIIGPAKLSVVPKPTNQHTAERSSNMDIEKLKAEHTALYNQLLAMGCEDGKKQGLTAERERISAHLVFAEQSGDFEFAAECIKDGRAATDQTVFAHHMSVGLKGGKQKARAGEEQNPGKPKGKSDDTAEISAETIDKVFAQVGENIGKKLQ